MKKLIILTINLFLLFLILPGFVNARERNSRSYPRVYHQNQDSNEEEYLGQYSNNPYNSQSTSNPYGQYGSPYSSKSINNNYGQYGSPYSSKSANNPYATDTPKLYSQDGKYLGKVSSNPYDPESISNPYGRYGSPYSPDSVNNPYGQYGSPHSSKSANNPYTTRAPVIYYGGDNE